MAATGSAEMEVPIQEDGERSEATAEMSHGADTPDHVQPKNTSEEPKGIENTGFVGDPPPYSPPDPKIAHLLYPSYPANFSGNTPVYYQSAPAMSSVYSQQNLAPGSYPYIINDSALGMPPSQPEVRTKDYMVESVLVTFFCCFLTGIIAVVYSHEVQSGDVAPNQKTLCTPDLERPTVPNHRLHNLSD
ncbi:proline rich transmembrane protein 1B isoform X2 [Bufo gargarizans]|uniref:proline rich transmembrane protein 1B isoform X2 n=1 Tax=Bufo gargarizans TaxID=30331 RepID=UPI001CF4AB10|nr:proline rich transmembrane protein 1B isoform X2 [Bufo gargarizans]